MSHICRFYCALVTTHAIIFAPCEEAPLLQELLHLIDICSDIYECSGLRSVTQPQLRHFRFWENKSKPNSANSAN